jgi:hypothetical protein
MNNKLTNNFDQDTDVFAKLFSNFFSNFFKFATAIAIVGVILSMTLIGAAIYGIYALTQYLNK